MKKTIVLFASHVLVGVIGFAAGIFMLPILTAPSAPSTAEVAAVQQEKSFSGKFVRELAGSDFLHWGEGKVTVGDEFITLQGKVSPGPDYKLYLSPEFVETEAEFEALKSSMVQVGDIKTFENFILPVTGDVDINAFNTVVIWCESFGEFITAATYQ